jgi:hypothetical protein
MSAQQVKTDRNDSRGLAHIMRTGWFREVHVKSHQSQKLRVALGNQDAKPFIWTKTAAQIKRSIRNAKLIPVT